MHDAYRTEQESGAEEGARAASDWLREGVIGDLDPPVSARARDPVTPERSAVSMPASGSGASGRSAELSGGVALNTAPAAVIGAACTNDAEHLSGLAEIAAILRSGDGDCRKKLLQVVYQQATGVGGTGLGRSEGALAQRRSAVEAEARKALAEAQAAVLRVDRASAAATQAERSEEELRQEKRRVQEAEAKADAEEARAR